MKVVIVGQGYVGLPLSIAIAEAGHVVIGFDSNSKLIENLKNSISHVEDISSEKITNLIENGKYSATSNPDEFSDSDVAIIAVPTPLNQNREPDLSYIESAATILGRYLKKPALIVNESTSFPGTLRNVIKPTVEKFSSFDIIHKYAISPERVDPGNKNWSIKTTPRLYAGLDDEASVQVKSFYSSFCDEIISTSKPEVAEAAKLFENTFRQVNIALVNEFALICDALDIPVREVIAAANSKPYGFMAFNPGLGVGGHCIPVDPSYLAFAARSAGIEPNFIQLANTVNLETPERIVERVLRKFAKGIEGKKVLIIGVAYKENISDTRESPSELLFKEFLNRKAEVFWLDPLVDNWQYSNAKHVTGTSYDIVVIAVLHDILEINFIRSLGNYIFDCTGKIKDADQI